jgi:DNA processing protein
MNTEKEVRRMLVHWIWLAHRPGLKDHMKVELLRHFSDPEDIYFADADAFAHVEGLTKENCDSLRDKDLSSSEKILSDVLKYKLHILTYRDVAYPRRLKAIADPPLVLYYKGSLPDFDSSPVIGVVGTRKFTPYGYSAAKKLGHEIAACGGMVVSGMAEGIDAAAMKSALSAGGTVVGILGCGAEQVYPRKNQWLFADTERYGCILSEFPPETPAFGWNFPKRNRIISGLSCGVLVVEAPKGSGSLHTARHALEQGRDVFVVPGNLDQPTFEGSIQLLRDGATLVSSGWDILSEYEALYPGKIRRETRPSRQRVYAEELTRMPEEAERELPKVAEKTEVPRPEPVKKEKSYKKDVDKTPKGNYSDVNKNLSALSPEQKAIVQALTGGERLVDQIIAETGLSAGKVSTALTMLVIKGFIKKLPGNRFSLK